MRKYTKILKNAKKNEIFFWDGECGMRDAGCRMRDAGCRMQDAGCGMQDAGCRMRDAGCGMQDAGCRMSEGSILRKRPQVERSDTVAATQRCERKPRRKDASESRDAKMRAKAATQRCERKPRRIIPRCTALSPAISVVLSYGPAERSLP